MANAQEEFQAFLDAQKAPEYDFASMTDEEKMQENFRYTELKLAVAKEQEARKKLDEEYSAKFKASHITLLPSADLASCYNPSAKFRFLL